MSARTRQSTEACGVLKRNQGSRKHSKITVMTGECVLSNIIYYMQLYEVVKSLKI